MMPFVLHWGAAMFQHLVVTVLRQCESFTLNYLDDIVIYSKTWKEHITHLHQVLQQLQDTGLKINPKKS